MSASGGGSETARIAILAYDDVEPIDIGATYGVFSMARRYLPGLSFFLVAERAGPVSCTNGLTVIAHHGFDDCPPHDALIVLGGAGWVREAANTAALDFIRRSAASSRLTASVCTGAMILGAAGLLDDSTATTRRNAAPGEDAAPLAMLADRVPGLVPREAAVIDSGAIVTGGGVTLAIDASLYLLERFFGPPAREQVARLIDYDTAYRANQTAFSAL